jgi:two-component SAPR family response regulator
MKTSILEEITPEICKEVLEIGNAQEILKYLQEEHLFVSCIDVNFRYHPLFRKFLMNCLKKEHNEYEIARLLKKTAEYFEKNQDLSQAINYYLRCESFNKAAKLIEKQSQDLFLHGKISQLLQWLGKIPLEIFHTFPVLLLRKAEGLIFEGKWEEAFETLNMTERILTKRRNKKMVAEVLYNKGIILSRLGKFTEASKIFRKATLLLGLGHLRLRAKIFHAIGWIESNMGNYSKAEEYFQKGIAFCQRFKDKLLESQFINALAVLAYRQSNLKRAIEYYEMLVNRYNKEIISSVNLANIYGNAASIYIEEGKYKMAEDLLKSAENIAQKYNDQRSLVYLAGVWGKLYLEQSDYDKAIECFEKVLAVNRRFGEEQINIFALHDLSTAAKEKGDYISAKEYLEEAEKIIKNKKGLTYLHHLFLKAELKNALKDDLNTASVLYKKVIILGKKLKAYRYIFKAWLSLMRKCIDDEKIKIALNYLSEASLFAKKEQVEKIFIQELQNNLSLFTLLLDKGVEKGDLIRLISQLSEPEAQIILRKIEKKDFDIMVEFFGGLRIKKANGQMVEPNWLTKKTKSLFAYLIANRQQQFQKELLIENFWPESEIKEGRHNLQMSISFLRKFLYEITEKKLKPKKIIQYQNDSYSLNPEIIFRIDAEEFDEIIHKAEIIEHKDKQKGFLLYKKAAEIYRGDYCADLYENWCEEKRIYYRELYLKVLKKIGEFLFENKNYKESLNFYRQALAVDKFDEAIHCRIMENLALLGNLKKAIEQYESLKRILKEELDKAPSPETTRVFQRLIQQHTG